MGTMVIFLIMHNADFVSSTVALLRGSWDLATRVIIKVTILIITYNPT